MAETISQFEQRKQDHIRLSLDPKTQTHGLSGFERLQLVHEAMPEIDFSEIDLGTSLFGQYKISSPYFISSMTAGHVGSVKINHALAQAAEAKNWPMGVGSQRRELYEPSAVSEWKELRKAAPKAKFLSNIGITQLIESEISDVQRLVDSLEAVGLFIHLNSLQECLQKEGTPNFRGGLNALEALCKKISVPVVVKEVGCGFSSSTLMRLAETGVAAIDVSGLGGTHWGRIEGYRSQDDKSPLYQASQVFKNWGVSTVESLLNAQAVELKTPVWASGGIRNGLDAAKCLALGAQKIGLAQPLLQAALQNETALLQTMESFEFELKVALFCTGCKIPGELKTKEMLYL